MNLILSESSASCAVKCPWQNPVERKVWYSRICLSERPRKRQLGKSKRTGSHCVVQVSIWSSPASSNGFTTKALGKEGSSQCVIVESSGPGRLIGVSNAIDCILFAEFTWVIVAISSRKGAHGIALLRFEKEGIQVKKVFFVPESPLHGIVLRGPHILYKTSENILLEGPDGNVALVGVDGGEMGPRAKEYFICGTEHDAEAVIATRDTKQGISESISLRTVRFSGVCESPWTAKDTRDCNLNFAAVSLHRGIFAVANYDGSLTSFDIHSGVVLWKTRPKSELENPVWLSFYRDTLLVIAGGSEAVWSVSIAASTDRNQAIRNTTLMFSEKCSVTTEAGEHGHVFAPWRESLLQLSDKNGCYCLDKEISTTISTAVRHQQKGIPFMHAVRRNLERRLDVGVERVTDAAERQEEKLGILNHVRSLLMEAAGEKTRVTFPKPKPFNGSLDNVIVLNGRGERRSGGSRQEEGNALTVAQVPSTHVVLGGHSGSIGLSRFVRLLESLTGVDRSGRFVLIQVRLAVSDVLSTDDSESATLSLRLNVQFDRCMSAIWDIEQRSRLRSGDSIWLRACAPISAIVANNVLSVENLRVIVRVDCDAGRSQHLDTFSFSAILSSIFDSESRAGKGTEHGLLTFERSIHTIAQGRSAHHLQRLRQDEASADEFVVNTREKLACISFKVTSNIQLALAIAKLRTSVDDDVSLRSSAELSTSSLKNVDYCLRKLEEEMQAVRNAVHRGSVGYDASQIQELLKLQLRVDESFGCIEEQFAGT